jgi:hypothetical protein
MLVGAPSIDDKSYILIERDVEYLCRRALFIMASSPAAFRPGFIHVNQVEA